MPTLPVAIETARTELLALNARAEKAADAAVPPNTRRAYEFELACFASWCTRHGARAAPVEPKLVRLYLRELADSGRHTDDVPSGRPKGPLGFSALMRALAAICTSEITSGRASVWNHPLIIVDRDTLAREKGTGPKKQKRDLGAAESLLFRVCDAIEDDLRGVRDRAMLLVGWQGGGRRRSEIVAARVEHFAPLAGGHFRWKIPRSKADQTGKGLDVPITLGEDVRYCPVRALRAWLSASHISSGPVFRGISPNGLAVMDGALMAKGVSLRIQHYVAKLAKIDPSLDPSDFGGHSLRSGFITTMYKMGRKIPDIMEASGHRNAREVLGYIRRAELVEESVAKGAIDEALAMRPARPATPKAESSERTFDDWLKVLQGDFR